MEILYVSNVGVWGGSVKSMYNTISTYYFKTKSRPVLLISNGNASQKFMSIANVISSIGIPQFDNTQYGYYRHTRWILLLRELYAFVAFLPTLFKLKKNFKKFDIIHFNEVVCFTSCAWLFRKIYPAAKIVTHIRSLQREDNGIRTKYISKQLINYASAIICIDNLVASTLKPHIRNKAKILYNINSTIDSKVPVLSNSISSHRKLNLLFLGGLQPVKGADFIPYIANLLQSADVEFLITIAGVSNQPKTLNYFILRLLDYFGIKSYYDTKKFLSDISKFGVEKNIRILNFQNDVDSLFRDTDILLFPSRLNAAGRPSIEAMGYGIPSIIFSNYSNNDVVVEGLTGYNIPDTNLKLFAKKIIDLNVNRTKLNELKVNCIKYFKENFSQEHHFFNLMKIYSDIRSDYVTNHRKH